MNSDINNKNTFSSRLNEIMLMRGVSAAKMAKDLKLTPSRVSSLRNNKVKDPRHSILEISRYLGVSANWLLHGEGVIQEDSQPIYILNKGQLQKTDEVIMLKGISNIKNSKVILTNKIDSFDKPIYIILQENVKTNGMYLFHKENRYFISIRTDDIIQTKWYHLSDNSFTNVDILGYVSGFFEE